MEKLWTKNFFILWQSQLVSTLGDAAYSVALGFWVLSKTGSTALMGTLMAASTFPGVLFSPFAGVLIDRNNRKLLLILMDILRGVSIITLSVAAFKGVIAIWMVFATGILLSVCGAVFRPGVNSSVPDLVPKNKLAGANSMLAIVSTGSNMLGNVAGGFLFQLLGAPFLFLLNGLSYLFSGSSLFFVKIPRNKKKDKNYFFQDMRDGFKFMWEMKGLRLLLIIAAMVNFLSYIAIVLFMPFFEQNPSLGPGKYGMAMACFMGGAMAGFFISSTVSVPLKRKLDYLILANGFSNLCLIISAYLTSFTAMILFLLIGGFLNAIANVIIMTTVQSAAPQEMRGKIMAFMSMITQSMTPFAMALGGVLAGYFPIRAIITASLMLVIVTVTPFYFMKSLKEFFLKNIDV
ncbi:MFS transporter [Ruminiclostridium papyrosolvens]|uniref:MFS transporter n=1 Tax=Ruminiclostridium papyrosolvens C7 TaxID=1330534 RepID=U4R1R1_9FIRM|nr:MFS transporter [Ruminiclostridium papyrosolvens]EPR12128.1 MFS transporter [Ruminiclostridium papyrosolvens C7]